MRHNKIMECSKCSKRLHNMITYKGSEYCNTCYKRVTGLIPKFGVKKMKCFSCGHEGYAKLTDVMVICRRCQVEMKEVRE